MPDIVSKPARELLTDKELHERYPNLSLYYINDARRRGILPHIAIPGIRKFLYCANDIEKWLSQNMKGERT